MVPKKLQSREMKCQTLLNIIHCYLFSFSGRIFVDLTDPNRVLDREMYADWDLSILVQDQCELYENNCASEYK